MRRMLCESALTNEDRLMHLLHLMGGGELPVLEAAELKRLLQERLCKIQNDKYHVRRIKALIWSLDMYLLGRTNLMIDYERLSTFS